MVAFNILLLAVYKTQSEVGMKQASYVALLIVMAVMMAAALTAFAIAFDSYVFKSENAFSRLDLEEAVSSFTNKDTLNTIMAQFQQLSLKFSSMKLLS